MKNNSIPYATYVGIDWADQKHDVSYSAAVGEIPIHQIIPSAPEALSEWLVTLRQKFPEGQIAVCLEQSRGPLIFHLVGYDFLTLFPVNPKTLARFREAFSSSGAKDDFSDADYLRELVMLHHRRLRAWKPDDEQSRTIFFLAEGRRKTVDDRTKLTNRLRATLKIYFPQALELVGDSLHSPMSLDFLHKWPQLSDIQKAHKDTVVKFYTAHNSRSLARINDRLHKIKTSVALTADRAVITSCLIIVKMIRAQISQLNTTIDEYDHKLMTLYDAHPDRDIFGSFPGAGNNLGPRLLSAWGADRERFDSPDSMEQYSGIAPVTKASGKTTVTVRRRACPKFLLQTFHEYANCSRQSSLWAQAYYEMKRASGKGHHEAVRSLAYKWIRIMYRCWQDRAPYDEVTYLRALQKNKSPVIKYLAIQA